MTTRPTNELVPADRPAADSSTPESQPATPQTIERPMACCPGCGEPLVATFEFRKKEWICMACLRLWEWLEARDGAPTSEMDARYEGYKQRYDAEREQRRTNGTHGQWPLVEADVAPTGGAEG